MDASCVSSSDDETCGDGRSRWSALGLDKNSFYTRSKKKAETEDKDFHKTECRREEIQQKTQIVKPKFRQFF